MFQSLSHVGSRFKTSMITLEILLNQNMNRGIAWITAHLGQRPFCLLQNSLLIG